MIELKIGNIIKLQELDNRRFLITKKDEGGFGLVFFLKSLSDFPDCVMKTFKNNVTFEDIEKEAFSWAQICSNKYIAEFICYGNYNKKPYVLSKRYTSTFEEIIKNPPNDDYIINIFKGVLNGLIYANKKLSLIHRDIKPANIFIDGDIPKIGDFGLAIYEKFIYKIDSQYKKYTKISEVTDDSFGGTYPFMAPELFRINPKFSVSTDIFAVGITFFLIYSRGLLPYDIYNHTLFPNAFKIFEKNCKNELIKQVILQCISLDQNTRYKRYEEIPFYEKKDSEVSVTPITEVLNTVQLLKRENKLDEALAYAKDELNIYKKHPLIINQIASIYSTKHDEKTFSFILSNYFDNIEITYEPYLYFDPLFTLANYYFNKDDSFSFISHLDKFKHYYRENKNNLIQYPEYGIYMGLKGYYFESYEIFYSCIKTIKIPPKYWLFFCCICYKINRYREFCDIIKTQEGKFEEALIEDTLNLQGFTALVNQSRNKYKEFMDAIFQ